jgi:hypothetical protein
VNRPGTMALVGALFMLLLVALPGVATDRDDDGLDDAFESTFGMTSPDAPDSDADGVVDPAEDSDGDRLSDLAEQRYGSDPGSPDSDADGVADSAEDDDGDGRANALEQDQRPLPPDLRPALAVADLDVQRQRRACQTKHGRSAVSTCTFGDPEADARIVLIGDSHASMFLTPFRRIAEQSGWKLTTMTKAACPGLVGLAGNNQWEIDGGRTCRLWQRRVLARLDKHPPDLVVYIQTPGYKLRQRDGRAVAPWRRTGEWRRALKRTVARLPEETTVLALGGTPRNFASNPVNCLRQHPDDISACVTRRQPEDKRTMDLGLQQGASVSRAIFDSIYDQICSYDPCPLVQGDVLMWRDGSHLSETFARVLQPSLKRVLDDALATRAEG